jgi:hypothetical protein
MDFGHILRKPSLLTLAKHILQWKRPLRDPQFPLRRHRSSHQEELHYQAEVLNDCETGVATVQITTVEEIRKEERSYPKTITWG